MAEASTAAAPHWRAAWQQARARQHSPAWLAGLRDQALGGLLARGLPDRRQEAWRYTSLEEFGERGAALLAAAAGAPALPGGGRQSIPGWAHGQILLVDGQPQPLAGTLPAGLDVMTLGQADAAAQAQITALLTAGGESPLVAMNTALLSDGLLLTTEPATAVVTPLLVTFLSSGAPVHAQPRLLVDLAPGSSLTLVVRHAGAGAGVVNCVTQIRCGQGSRLRLIRLQECAMDTLLVEATRLDLAADAHVEVTTVDLGAALSRHDLSIALGGPGASAEMHGLFLADGSRHVDNHACMDHQAPRTRSRQEFRGILADSGRGVFNGRIVVGKRAAGTDAALTNRNLLLARTAEIDTKPELEIHTDDVRCSHGATTGQLDPGALFYLRARGLDESEARRMLMTAFAAHILDVVTEPTLRAHLADLLARQLGGGAVLS